MAQASTEFGAQNQTGEQSMMVDSKAKTLDGGATMDNDKLLNLKA